VGLLRSIATLLFVLAVPIALVTLNVRYAFNEPRLWEHGFERYRVDLRTGLEMSEVDRAAARLRHYFNDDSERFEMSVVDDGRVVRLYSEKETQHLVDVKELLLLVYRIQAAAVAFALVYMVTIFVWAREMPVRMLARRLLTACIATIALLAAFGAVAVTGFDRLWRQFHVFSFSNDLWQLNPATDRLIQMFPTPFWQDATFFVASLTMGQATLMGAISLLYLRATRARDTDFPPGDFSESVNTPVSEGAST
jgi:integral membrane protein (TIGR01906 family)